MTSTTGPATLRMSQVVTFDADVSAEFFAKLMKVAEKEFGNTRLSIREMEAIRRSCAVIEKICSGSLSVVADATANPG